MHQTATYKTYRMNSMQSLKNSLDAILPIIGDKKIIYLDYPLHSNIGDLLIMEGTLHFFKQHKLTLMDSFSVYDFDINLIKNKYNLNESIIVFHGGGNYGDLYAPHQNLRRTVFRELPNQKMLMLPQSLHYDSETTELEDISLISQLTNATFCVRDEASCNHFNKAGQPVLLVPDMAHSLYGSLKKSPTVKLNHLFFLRKDKEINLEQNNITNASVDWDDLIKESDQIKIRRFRKNLARLKKYRSLLPTKARPLFFVFWRRFSKSLIDRSSLYFSNHKEITTSRLHGYILAALLDMKTNYIDNSYHKLSRYTTCWITKASEKNNR